MLSGRGLCDELITRPEESYRLWCVVVCDVETLRIGAPYIYDISNLRVNVSVRMREVRHGCTCIATLTKTFFDLCLKILYRMRHKLTDLPSKEPQGTPNVHILIPSSSSYMTG